MGAGAIHGQKKSERPGTASLLEVNHFGDVTKMICPCSPLPDAHLASGSFFLQGSNFCAIRAARVTEFAVTDRSTGLMEGLHLLAAEGCTMQGLCKVTRSEIRWEGEGPTEYEGILFCA